MGAERAQGGRGWVRIPASRAEQSPARPAAAAASGPGPFGSFGSGDQASIYLSLVKRWREAGRTLPGHPDEEWERLISQPCWPGR
ncbi:hypothetical protein [Streptomyces sp. RerS4]|uniref:hypothetical protein n=1 Tax=Streptomyces sp. RerS4 TaxID=2942449 RepID=UPI00201C0355|nr:hypothetical protein [Streptomyces sp. RerS4]UQX01548.1 hypothetical protein M4D82_14285 [Streptomyces sp. RerS4]